MRSQTGGHTADPHRTSACCTTLRHLRGHASQKYGRMFPYAIVVDSRLMHQFSDWWPLKNLTAPLCSDAALTHPLPASVTLGLLCRANYKPVSSWQQLRAMFRAALGSFDVSPRWNMCYFPQGKLYHNAHSQHSWTTHNA